MHNENPLVIPMLFMYTLILKRILVSERAWEYYAETMLAYVVILHIIAEGVIISGERNKHVC